MGLSCEWYGDGYSQVYVTRYPVATKEYKCQECRDPINKGDLYQRTFAIHEGEANEHKACERCGDLISSVEALGYCWTWGNFLWDYSEWLRDSELEYPDWLCETIKIEKWKEQETG